MAYYGGGAKLSKDSETTTSNDKRTFIFDAYNMDLVEQHGAFYYVDWAHDEEDASRFASYMMYGRGNTDLSRSYGYIDVDL